MTTSFGYLLDATAVQLAGASGGNVSGAVAPAAARDNAARSERQQSTAVLGGIGSAATGVLGSVWTVQTAALLLAMAFLLVLYRIDSRLASIATALEARAQCQVAD